MFNPAKFVLELFTETALNTERIGWRNIYEYLATMPDEEREEYLISLKTEMAGKALPASLRDLLITNLEDQERARIMISMIDSKEINIDSIINLVV